MGIFVFSRFEKGWRKGQSMIQVTLKGDKRQFEAGITAAEVAKSIGAGLYKAACAAKVDGEACDLRTPLEKDCTLEIMTFDSPEGQHAFWHTAAHVMAQAVQHLFPRARFGIGPALENGWYYDIKADRPLTTGDFDAIEGDLSTLRSVEMVDQNPIGKSSRSNPVTYIKAYDEIRKLYADQPYAQRSGFNPSHFSFNIAGGRCEECQGEGFIKVGMQFMADMELVCEACGGKRFKDEILEVRYREKSIYDILEMTVDDAIAFFGEEKKNATCKRIIERLRPLQEVGLGYIRLGQSSSTLSGGESQRVKLASFLSKESTEGNVMFIFDEPTTGLHFHDINKLLDAFNALIARGHTIVIVEHNMDVIKCADWVVDLGPEAGDRGGSIVFEGTPDGLAGCKESYTGRYLALREKNE